MHISTSVAAFFCFFPCASLGFSPSLHNFRTISAPLYMATSDDPNRKEPTVDKPPTEPGSHEELMYTLGVNLARQLGDVRPLVENGEELTFVAKGLLDAVVGRLSEEGQVALLSARRNDLNTLITDRAEKIRNNVVKAGESMLKTMSETEGVQTFPSGVRLHILDEGPGNGQRPTAASTVKCHYHGTLPDGTVFDSSLGQENPVRFAVGQLIEGMKEGLLKMSEGQTAMIGIPSSLAYGPNGSPDGSVPGGAAIFFKVQLIEVMSAGVGGGPTLLGADGKALSKSSSSVLLGANGKPLV